MKIQKLSVSFLISLLLLAGCQKENTSSKGSLETSSPITDNASSSKEEEPIDITWVVTFDYNYEGAPESVKVKVSKGTPVASIDDPVREGYSFLGWFKEKEGENEVDFSMDITSDVTYYAHWEKVDVANSLTVTFDYNFENGGVYKTVVQKKKRRITKSVDPVREGYRFAGWYEDKEGKNIHDFDKIATEDTTLYAFWLKETVFEAEYTDLDGKAGLGYSGNCSDIEMIQKDIYNGGASNGFYVSWLYYNGAELEWEIKADKEVKDVWLTARLSVEFFDMQLNQDTYQTYVNDVLQSEKYSIDLSGAIAAGTKAVRPFKDYVLNTKVTLSKGVNKIRLMTNNSDYYTGTMSVSSPMVDCIKLATNDAALSWNEENGFPKTNNLRLYK